jgi:DNA-nicking Smr family endonuclease
MGHRKIKYRLRSKSFADLKELLQNYAVSLPDRPPALLSDTSENKKETQPVNESDLLSKAMKGVVPIEHEDYVEKILPVEITTACNDDTNDDAAAMARLSDLVNHGRGFVIADTPEYIEGTGYHVHSAVARHLHEGNYSIQAYVDLHGLLVDDAQEAFEKFLKEALTAGKTGVLIIHGRGLSSPDEPVLKKKVIEWLSHKRWKKWIVAYASARACDGGAGATYVLLRRRPTIKKVTKTKK